jgi:hypothetical protein
MELILLKASIGQFSNRKQKLMEEIRSLIIGATTGEQQLIIEMLVK